MKSRILHILILAPALLLPTLAALPAKAQLGDGPPVQTAGVRPALLRDVGLDQKLGDALPLDLTFRDEQGRTVALRQFFGQKPVILTLVYYQCPMLCTEVLNGLLNSTKELPLEIGKDFNIVTVSIDPSERTVLASVKHQLYTGLYGRPGGPQGWHFLTGDEPQIKALAACRGIPLRLRLRIRPVRSSQRNHAAHARGQVDALFLRHRLSLARFAAGAGGSVARQDRFSHRSGFALLLSLRPPNGTLWIVDLPRPTGGRRSHGALDGSGHPHSLSPRELRARKRNAQPWKRKTSMEGVK